FPYLLHWLMPRTWRSMWLAARHFGGTHVKTLADVAGRLSAAPYSDDPASGFSSYEEMNGFQG
ncbi:MAG: hypothetical protein KKB08_10135, partial [Gammaproteobacteria bacterium]|nr:hypothetical protein [Gammaproteobacteria bacterium]